MVFNRALGAAVLAGAVLAPAAYAQSCASPVSGNLPDPVVADGYSVNLISDEFTYPRGIAFDSAGNLLVVDQNEGIYAIGMEMDNNGCVTSTTKKTVLADKSLNHGIQISEDGKTLYASSMESVWSWTYNAQKASVDGDSKKLLISNMTNTDHTTRTLLLSKFMPGMLLVSRGSMSNVDRKASDINSGHSQIKAFNINNMTSAYDFTKDGMILGWGLRNDVGIAEEPNMGGIYAVENSVDEMERMGVDIHNDNPGEELNYLGTLKNNMSPNQGGNFGYPECYAAWGVEDIPDRKGLKVGMQFAIGSAAQISDMDDMCRNDRIAPRLTFEAHMAPLDIVFDSKGTQAWITFHGSWNRDPPAGYKLSVVEFADGEPVEPSTSTKAAVDIVMNQDPDNCPDNCIRPVGLAWDSMNRLWFTSDASGEVYMLMQQGSRNGAIDSSTNVPKNSDGDNAASVAQASLLSVLAAGAAAALWLL